MAVVWEKADDVDDDDVYVIDWKFGLKGKVFEVPAGATVKFEWSGPHAVSEMVEAGCDFEGATYIGDESGVTVSGEPGDVKFYACPIGRTASNPALSHCLGGQQR